MNYKQLIAMVAVAAVTLIFIELVVEPFVAGEACARLIKCE